MERRYLIVKTSSLGDVVQCLPVANYLKSIDPTCKIDWIVEKGGSSLLRACPLLDRVIVVDTKKWRSHLFSKNTWEEIFRVRHQIQEYHYDMVFDLQGNVKSGFFTCLSKAKVKGGFGKESVPEWPNRLFTNKKVDLLNNSQLNISEDYLWMVSQLLGKPMPQEALPPFSFNVDPVEARLVESLRGLYRNAILVAPGSVWENKRLSKEQLEVLLAEQPVNVQIFLSWGTDEELELCRSLTLSHANVSVLPKLSLEALQLFMSKMNLVISMDSLPLHLAATTGVPTFSFFGPSSALKYAPRGPQHRHVQGACPYDETFVKRCPKLRTCPTGDCIKKL